MKFSFNEKGVTFLVLLKKSFLEMLLFLLMLLDVAVAVDNNDSNTSFDGLESVAGMSTEMVTEHRVEGSSSNSEEPHFGPHFSNNTDNHVNGTEFDSEMSTEVFVERTVRGFYSNSDSFFNNSTESNVNGTELGSRMTTDMSTEGGVKGFNLNSDEKHSGPYFDDSNERAVTVLLGSTTNLRCRVRQLGDRKVAWIRPEKHSVLTIGLHTISSDSRMASFHLKNSDDWNLEITNTTQQDEGVYSCQVNTDPIMSFNIVLNVVPPKAKIKEGSNLYVQSGRTILLTCVVSGGTSELNVGTWFKGDRNVDHYSRKLFTHSPGRVITYANQLVIPYALSVDSGNYSCRSFNAVPASISVHVFNDQGPITTTVKPVTMTEKPVATTVKPVTTTEKPVATTVKPVTTPVAHRGQQSNSAFQFVPVPLLLLLQSLLWILQMWLSKEYY